MARDREKQTEFVVTDRRKFTLDGEARTPVEPEQEKAAPAPPPPPQQDTTPESAFIMPGADDSEEQPVPPTLAEQAEQNANYAERTKILDERLQKELDAHGSGRRLKDYEMTFEKFVGSIYMSALMQLGLVHEQGGEARADLIGSRQTIDTLEIIAHKTRGNLTPKEEALLQNCLYEVRMAYIELTNQLAHPPEGVMPLDPNAGLK